MASSFVRHQSNGGEEKVKGQVIGIDLGMWSKSHNRLSARRIVNDMYRHNQLSSSDNGRKDTENNRKLGRLANIFIFGKCTLFICI